MHRIRPPVERGAKRHKSHMSVRDEIHFSSMIPYYPSLGKREAVRMVPSDNGLKMESRPFFQNASIVTSFCVPERKEIVSLSIMMRDTFKLRNFSGSGGSCLFRLGGIWRPSVCPWFGQRYPFFFWITVWIQWITVFPSKGYISWKWLH
jgi:hypothetical protein